MALLFIGTLFFLIIIGVPIAFSLLATSFTLMVASGDIISLTELARNFTRGINSFPLLAIPFFMLAGEIMNRGGISSRIVEFSRAIVGHITGGLGYVGVLSSMFFAGISGSAIADTTAVGSILLPIMDRHGYNKTKSTALICASGCIGPIIPPSIAMIFFGVVAEVSIVKLFLGGIIPGVLIGLALMVGWFIHAKKADYPKGERYSLKDVFISMKKASLALILPVIIVGGIVLGIMTPTESAVVAVVYAFIVAALIYRELDLKELPRIFIATARGTAAVLFVCGAATAAAHLITTARIPEMLFNMILSISDNVYIAMLIINLLLLAAGCVLDLIPALLLTVPIIMPVAANFGLDPIYVGVVVCTNLCIGLITPPVGNVLYVGCSLSKISITELVRDIWPQFFAMILVLLLITIFPDIIMFIPNLMN